jgi:hypothetical protein
MSRCLPRICSKSDETENESDPQLSDDTQSRRHLQDDRRRSTEKDLLGKVEYNGYSDIVLRRVSGQADALSDSSSICE